MWKIEQNAFTKFGNCPFGNKNKLEKKNRGMAV